MTVPTPDLLRFTAVACVRGGRMLFSGLDFVLGPGGLLWLRGPNGAGKSSAIRLAAGLLTPFAGTVDRPVGVALADERLALDHELPLAKALAFWAAIDQAPRDALDAALQTMGLAALAAVPVAMLSTGQRKRASLARVIASAAPLWLLDEPANGLDNSAMARLEAAIARHRADGGAVLLASHQALDLPGAEERLICPPAQESARC